MDDVEKLMIVLIVIWWVWVLDMLIIVKLFVEGRLG